MTMFKNLINNILFLTNISPSFQKNKKRFFIKKIQDRNKTLLLRSMTKSGSHYLLCIIGNYINKLYFKQNQRISITDLKKTIWNTNLYNRNLINDLDKLENFYFKFFWFLHDYESMRVHYLNCKKVIHLYRNPFDCLTSNYFFFIKKRKLKVEILDYIDDYMPKYIRSYQIMKKYKNKNNILSISYEELIQNTKKTLETLLFFLNFEINSDLLEKALADSTKDQLIREEKNYSLKNLVSPKVDTSFVRSGEIGNFKNNLSSLEIDKIKKYLNKHNIKEKEFNI